MRKYNINKTDGGKGLAKKAMTKAIRAQAKDAVGVEGPLPAPLSWSDQCECGMERWDHSGKHGWGGCSANECPSFKEV
jgi:hypothetical protein